MIHFCDPCRPIVLTQKMFSRNRNQSYQNVRKPNNPTMGYQGQSTYNQQPGPYPSQQNQQSSFKPGNIASNLQPFKPLQPQQQPAPVPVPAVVAKNMQQGKPPQQQQQIDIKQNVTNSAQQQMQQTLMPQAQSQLQSQPQSQPQPQQHNQSQPQPQSQLQATPTTPRLKPILKVTSHSTQQQQQQQQQQQPAAAAAVQNNPVTSSQPIIPTSTPSATSYSNCTSPTSSDKTEVKSETQTESMDVEMQDAQPRWRRKAPGFRVNKRLKRLRLNQRLRKTLQPKNAIMVLNEMKPGVQFTFPETQGPMPNSLYLVHAELDGKTYVGQGLSKPLARQNAAENALKALLLEKMTAASIKARIDAELDRQNQCPDGSNTSRDDNEEASISMDTTTTDETDEIPWSSLASFALYKLFLEWHNQGTSVPVPRPGIPSPIKGAKKEVPQTPKAPVQKELPPNATSIHPVMLLNQMRPGLTYVELNRVGNPPNTMFTLAVEIDGVEYTGTAKNKKDAKKIAAKSALLALYNLYYPDEVKSTVQDQPTF